LSTIPTSVATSSAIATRQVGARDRDRDGRERVAVHRHERHESREERALRAELAREPPRAGAADHHLDGQAHLGHEVAAGEEAANRHVPKLTNSVRTRHEGPMGAEHACFMRYLAAAMGFLGAIVLLLPVH
jgi:hypothetical protein